MSCGKEDCKEPVLYHKYIRRSISPEALDEYGPAKEDEGWAPLPAIDGDLCDVDLAPRMTAEFVRAREKFLTALRGSHEVSLQWHKTFDEWCQKRRHLRSPEHARNCNCLDSTQNNIICYAEYDAEDLRSKFERVDREFLELESDVGKCYLKVLELEGDGQGTIMGLDAVL